MIGRSAPGLTSMSRIGVSTLAGTAVLSNDSRHMKPRARTGTSVAPLVWVRGTAAVSLLLMGCLVTGKKEFPQEPECVPSLDTASLADPETPLDRIVRLDLDDLEGPDAGTTSQIFFQAQVRDCNESQTLDSYALLDYRPEFGTAIVFGGGAIPPEARLLRVPLSVGTVMENPGRCHRVEIRVSGAFKSFPAYTPAKDGDMGVAVWWLAVTDDMHTTVDMSTCP